MSMESSSGPLVSMKLAGLAVFWTVTLITANIMACKIASFGPVLLPASVILFPLCFMLGTILSEVWGAWKAFLVFVVGFAANFVVWIFMNFAVWLSYIPELNSPNIQTNLELIFQTQFLRILLASAIAFAAGGVINGFVLSFLKKMGWVQRLYMRMIVSVVIGQFFDTALFVVIAYGGRLQVAQLLLVYYIVKVVIGAVICAPAAYILVHWARN